MGRFNYIIDEFELRTDQDYDWYILPIAEPTSMKYFDIEYYFSYNELNDKQLRLNFGNKSTVISFEELIELLFLAEKRWE